MRLITFRHGGSATPIGTLLDNHVIDDGELGYPTQVITPASKDL